MKVMQSYEASRQRAEELIGTMYEVDGEEWKVIGVGNAPRRDMVNGIYLTLSRPNQPVRHEKIYDVAHR